MNRLALLALCALVAGTASAASHREGATAPALHATALDGTVLDLQQHRGHVVLVSFWATWCGPCRLEMPELDRLYRRHHDEGLDIIGISMDEAADREAALAFVRDFAYPVAMQQDADFRAFGRIWAIPLLFVIDRHGLLRVDGRPAMQEKDFPALEKEVAALLAEKP